MSATTTKPLIYIAGPMTGYEDFNYPAFNAAQTELENRGFAVLNPVAAENENPTPGIPQSWDWYMRRALAMVLSANAICLLPGHENSRGAKLEVQVGRALHHEVRTLADWLWGSTEANSTIEAALLTPVERAAARVLLEPIADILPNPDCVAGKHTNCDGSGWDNELDEPTSCPCACHDTTTEAAA